MGYRTTSGSTTALSKDQDFERERSVTYIYGLTVWLAFTRLQYKQIKVMKIRIVTPEMMISIKMETGKSYYIALSWAVMIVSLAAAI